MHGFGHCRLLTESHFLRIVIALVPTCEGDQKIHVPLVEGYIFLHVIVQTCGPPWDVSRAPSVRRLVLLEFPILPSGDHVYAEVYMVYVPLARLNTLDSVQGEFPIVCMDDGCHAQDDLHVLEKNRQHDELESPRKVEYKVRKDSKRQSWT